MIEMEAGIFNTSNSNLWTKLQRVFEAEIKAEYSKMRQAKFTEENLMKYLYGEQISQIPQRNYNLDMQNKYLNFGNQFLHACHGNGYSHMKRWVRERLFFLDTLLDYTITSADYITIRANKLGSVYLDIQTYVPMYARVKWRDEANNTGTQIKKINRGETVRFTYTMPTATDQEVIVYGGKYLKDVGDLTNLQPTTLLISKAPKLTRLVCTNNPNLINTDLSSCTLLQEIDLSGCSQLGGGIGSNPTLNVQKCTNLRRINIYDTQLTAIYTNTSGGNLQEINYPFTVQTVQIHNQPNLKSIGIPVYFINNGNENNRFANKLVSVDIANCENLTSMVKNYYEVNGQPVPVPTFLGVSSAQSFKISNSLTDLERIDLSYCANLRSLSISDFYKLTEINFDDICAWDANYSNLSEIIITNCPYVETMTFNQNTLDGPNSLGVAFAHGMTLDLSNLLNLKHIRSNVGVKGLKRIIVPPTVTSLVFDYPEDTRYSQQLSDIESIWSIDALYAHENDEYKGIDLRGMDTITDFSMGSLASIDNADNLNIKITNTFPYFNYFRNSNFFKPTGTVNISDYKGSLAYLFKGIDMDKLEIICDKQLTQTDAKYMFAYASCSDEDKIVTLFSKMQNITNLSYMFYNAFIRKAPLLPLSTTDCRYMFYNCSTMTETPANWLRPYTITPQSDYCYTGCVNINMIDGEPDTLDSIPSAWGGFGRSNVAYSGYEINATNTLEREIETATISGLSLMNIAPEYGVTPKMEDNQSSFPINNGIDQKILIKEAEYETAVLKGHSLTNLVKEKGGTQEFERLTETFKMTDGLDLGVEVIDGEFIEAKLHGNTLQNIVVEDGKTSEITNVTQSFDIDNNINDGELVADGDYASMVIKGNTLTNIVPRYGQTDIVEITGLVNVSDVVSEDVIICDGEMEKAIIKGQTKYRDIDTGDILDTYDSSKNLELVSCKMPVLSTVGKNLLNINGLRQENACIDNSDGQVKNSNGHMAFLDYIQIPSDKNITFFNNTVYSGAYLKISFYDEDKQFISGNSFNTGSLIVVSPSNAKYCRVSGFYHPNDFDLQLEVGGRSSYEPYKSNILTVNEDVELGSVGEVKDELNLLTGQLTQRTDIRPYQESDESDSEVLTDMTNTRYKLPKEVIKTVDLTIVDQDNNNVESLHSYKDGYITTSSNQLTPTLSCAIPTSNYFPTPQMESNTQYTLYFDNEVSSVNVGGNEVTSPTSPMIVTSGSQKNVKFDGEPNKVMLFKGDVRDQTIHYFTGSQSIEKPVFETTGKNLFDWTSIANLRNNNQYRSDFIRSSDIKPFYVEEGETYLAITKGTVDDGEYSAMYLGGDDLKYDNDPNGQSKALIVQGTGGHTLKDGLERRFLIKARKNCLVTKIMIHGSGISSLYTVDYIGIFKTGDKNIAYCPYVSNMLYLPTSLILRSNGDVRDEYNPLTSQFTQRIDEDGSVLSRPVTTTVKSIVAYDDIVRYGYELPDQTTDLFHPEAQKYEKVIDLGTLNGTEEWTKVSQYVFTVPFTNAKAGTSTDVLTQKDQIESISIDNSALTLTFKSDSYMGGNNVAVNALKIWLQSNNVQFKYELKNHILTSMTLEEFNFENAHFVKPQAYKGGVVTQSNKDNLIFTPITYQTKSNNRYELPMLESNSEYTLRYEGSANQVTLGGSATSIENNCLVQSGSANKVALFNDEVSNVMLIKNDVREQTIPYFRGLLSVVNPRIKTFSDNKSNILSCNEEIILRSNGDICDELDLITKKLTQRIDENNEVLSQEIVKTVDLSIVDQDNQPIEQMNYFTDYYGEIKSNGTLPRLTYKLQSTNTFAVEQLKPNTLYTMYSEGEAIVATLGGKASILLQNPQTVTSGSVNKSLTFDSAVSRVILIESDVRNQVIPYFTGTLDVINPIIKTTSGSKTNTVNTNVRLRSVGNVRDTYDLKTGILTKRISDNYTVLDSPQTQTISVAKPISYNGAIVELSSNTTSLLPYFEYSCKSPNYYQAPIESGEIYTVKFTKTSNGTLTMGGVTANTTGNQVITTKNSDVKAILFSGDLGISDLMIMKTDVRNVPTPYFRGLKDVVNPTITVSDGNRTSNSVSITATMRSLPNGTKDELNLVTGEFVQRVGQRNYEDGDSNGPSMITDGITTLYQLPIVKRSNLSLSWSNGVLTAYDGSTIITSEAELLKPHLYFRIPTSTLEELVSILEEKNANLTSQMVDLEVENLMTMVALAEVYEAMMNTPTTTSSTSSNTKDVLMTAMVGVYAKLVTAGVKTIDEVPEHLQINVTKLLKK